MPGPEQGIPRLSSQPLLVWGGVATAAVAGYFAVRNVDAQEMWDAVATSDYRWLVPAVVALAAAVALRAVRWRAMFAAETRPPFGPTLRALLVGYLFNNILPARAGEPARIVALQRWAKTPWAESAGTVVAERVYDVLCLLVIFFAALPWLPDVGRVRVALIFAVTLLLLVGVGVAILRRYEDAPLRFVLRPLARLPLAGSLDTDALAKGATRGLVALSNTRLGVTAFVWTTASWLLIALSAWFVLLALDLGLSPMAGILVVIATGLAMILPAPPAAVGVYEGAALVALGAYAVPSSVALSCALVLHAVNFFPFLAAGAVALRRP
jgi:glycosyltransferase 2 family protein